MRIFFDTEFTKLSKNGQLLSLGMISDDDHKFYWEFNDFWVLGLNKWIKENVIEHCIYINTKNNGIINHDLKNYCDYGDHDECKVALTKWFKQFGDVELVSDVAHYDMVFLINIFGTAFDLPENVCPACHDINQDIARFHGVDLLTAFNMSREDILTSNDITIEGTKHNAFYDAEVIRAIYYLMNRGDN